MRAGGSATLLSGRDEAVYRRSDAVVSVHLPRWRARPAASPSASPATSGFPPCASRPSPPALRDHPFERLGEHKIAAEDL